MELNYAALIQTEWRRKNRFGANFNDSIRRCLECAERTIRWNKNNVKFIAAGLIVNVVVFAFFGNFFLFFSLLLFDNFVQTQLILCTFKWISLWMKGIVNTYRMMSECYWEIDPKSTEVDIEQGTGWNERFRKPWNLLYLINYVSCVDVWLLGIIVHVRFISYLRDQHSFSLSIYQIFNIV